MEQRYETVETQRCVGSDMRIGDICRVIKNGHQKPQKGDLIMITRLVGSVYVEGTNLRTNTRHHYLKTELEVVT